MHASLLLFLKTRECKNSGSQKIMNQLVGKSVTVNLKNGFTYYGTLKEATDTEITLYTRKYGMTILQRSFVVCIYEDTQGVN